MNPSCRFKDRVFPGDVLLTVNGNVVRGTGDITRWIGWTRSLAFAAGRSGGPAASGEAADPAGLPVAAVNPVASRRPASPPQKAGPSGTRLWAEWRIAASRKPPQNTAGGDAPSTGASPGWPRLVSAVKPFRPIARESRPDNGSGDADANAEDDRSDRGRHAGVRPTNSEVTPHRDPSGAASDTGIAPAPAGERSPASDDDVGNEESAGGNRQATSLNPAVPNDATPPPVNAAPKLTVSPEAAATSKVHWSRKVSLAVMFLSSPFSLLTYPLRLPPLLRRTISSSTSWPTPSSASASSGASWPSTSPARPGRTYAGAGTPSVPTGA